MSPPPLYTSENTVLACPLQWGLTVFWRAAPESEAWFAGLAAVLETDGIRLLGHRFATPAISQFAISTRPEVVPLQIVQRVKGRLQHAVREQWPKALRGNYALRSFGNVTQEVVERYVQGQWIITRWRTLVSTNGCGDTRL